MNKLNCKKGNSQCGGVCQPDRYSCKSNLSQDSLEELNEISENIEPKTTVHSLSYTIKKTLDRKNIADTKTIEENIDPNDIIEIKKSVNGVEVYSSLFSFSYDDFDLLDAVSELQYSGAKKEYIEQLQKSKRLYSADFKVNDTFLKSSDQQLLSKIPEDKIKEYGSNKIALAETKKSISREIKKSYNKMLSNAPDGSVIYSNNTDSDGKGKGRSVLYERQGMESSLSIKGTYYSVGIVYKGRIVSADKYKSISTTK